MKLSRTDAQAQGRRLQSVIPSAFPKATADEMRTEVVNALQRNCVDVSHASRAVTMVLDSAPDPKNLIAEIRRCATETMDRQQFVPEGCDVCRLGPDPTTGAARWMAHVPLERNGYTYAVRCACDRGQWLKRRDQERSTEQPARKSESRHEHPADADIMRLAAGDRE